MQCRACRAESKETPAFIHLLFLHEKEMNHHSGVPSLLQAFFRPSMRHERTELNKAVEPHSLSYQDTSLTKVLFSEMPALMSTTEEVFSPTKSVETTSSSTYPRIPFIGPSASALMQQRSHPWMLASRYGPSGPPPRHPEWAHGRPCR